MQKDNRRERRDQETDYIWFNAHCTEQHLTEHFSVSSRARRGPAPNPFFNYRTILLFGDVEPTKDMSAKRVCLTIYCHERMREVTKILEEVGYYHSQKDEMLITSFWPLESFNSVAAMVANKAVRALQFQISRPKRGAGTTPTRTRVPA